VSWIGELETDFREAFDQRPRIVTLATIARDRPDARSIVVRKLNADGSMLFTSDYRSGKNAQLRANPRATLVIWLAPTQRQYRVHGHVEVLNETDPVRAEFWEKSSDESRTMFFWPEPGLDFDPSAELPAPVNAAYPMPASFAVMRFCPEQADTLDLKPNPHRRERWTLDHGKWSSVRVNA
jgi:pyridoxamine 5'-phosphate oxidase